jgi:hypothetical protein
VECAAGAGAAAGVTHDAGVDGTAVGAAGETALRSRKACLDCFLHSGFGRAIWAT